MKERGKWGWWVTVYKKKLHKKTGEAENPD